MFTFMVTDVKKKTTILSDLQMLSDHELPAELELKMGIFQAATPITLLSWERKAIDTYDLVFILKDGRKWSSTVSYGKKVTDEPVHTIIVAGWWKGSECSLLGSIRETLVTWSKSLGVASVAIAYS